MKTIILAIILSLGLYTANSNAAEVGSAFSYQGELLENGAPANGVYDFVITLYVAPASPIFVGSQHINNITVTNGVFTLLEVDFGDAVYTGTDLWLEIGVKPDGIPSYTTLVPRQRLNAVPYAVQAEFLAANGASNGDVLQFDGTNWIAATGVASPWIVGTNSDIGYGSSVGVGTTTPTAKLHVRSESLSGTPLTPLLVQLGTGSGSKKLQVHDNGGMSVGNTGSLVTPPDDGLHVSGNVKQDKDAKGMLKYMFRADCNTTAPVIVRHYNGTDTGALIGISITNNGIAGKCVITLPFDISNDYFSVTPSFLNSGSNRIANCKTSNSSNLDLNCQVSNGATGNEVDGVFDVLIF